MTFSVAMTTDIHAIFVEYDDVLNKYVLWMGAHWLVLKAPDLPAAYAEVEIAFSNGVMPQIVDIIINPCDNDPIN